jgi:hypothetical protein
LGRDRIASTLASSYVFVSEHLAGAASMKSDTYANLTLFLQIAI